ncbi:neutral peptidase B [Scopulibacillus darangshiensis]|uniref:Neutral metalloproteinase n=1 Tax=Scopulibacillus darangshiensis TaxID=442528 RepID=A0A4R2P376_9BACL|nr:M4 family metallopeptidase [Scopulibacillus darangshiensis]TCP29219.1 neutral peptidase B [Scopulibacillus darangshiensis]
MKKKLISSSLALSIALGGFAAVGNVSHAKAAPKVELNDQFKTPSYIIEKWQAPRTLAKTKSLSKKDIAFAYLNYKSKQLKLKGDMKNHFKVVKEHADKKTDTYHIKLVEQYKGIPVFATDQKIALDDNNNVTSFFGQVIPNLEDKNIPTKASISGDKAVSIAKEDIEKEIGKVDHYDGDVKSKLYVYEKDGEYYLAYLVKASLSDPAPGYWHYFIDATNGKVIHKVNAIDNMTGFGKGVFGEKQKFEIAKGDDGQYYLYDGTRGKGIHTFDAKEIPPFIFNILSGLFGYTGEEIKSNHKFFSDPAAVDAHVNAEKVYDYYKDTFNRNSFDNEGAQLISSVHVGNGWNNAAWNGVLMMYGDGDGTTFTSLSGGLDVIAHELTHAVTERSANLVYEGEPGALNESLSDIMGAMVDRDDWQMGEDIYTPDIEGDALRSLNDPASIPNPLNPSEGYPDNYSKRYTGDLDHGGVHINSSINNKAAYLLSDGGTAYGVTVKGVGRDAAEQIYYRAVNNYMTANSDFSMMRQAAIQAATDLYGADSSQVESVKKAYDAVGVE